MQGDEIAPAEFLFGKLASDFLKVQTPPKTLIHLTGNDIKKFNFALSFYLILELILTTSIIVSVTIVRQLDYLVIVLFLVRIMIIAKKNTSLTRRYAPDLASHNYIKFSFSFVQLLLSGGLFVAFSVSVFMLHAVTPEVEILDEYKLILFVIVIFYVNVISDLALAALGKGVGIFGQSHRFKTLFHNISELARIKGKKSTQLAILRAANWLLVYYFVVNIELNWFIAPYSLISFYYLQKWEKVNSASLFMDIRSEIAIGKPAILPHKLFIPEEQPTESDLNGYTSVNHDKIETNSFRKYQKSPRNQRSRSDKLRNLSPIAARSLSKIADTIKEEENSLPSNLVSYCINCNMEVITSSNYCSYCGERN